MNKKRILICCANGVATSTFVSMKCKNKFKEWGINAEIKTCTSLDIKTQVKNFKPDLVISNVGTNINIPEDTPVIYGVNLLSGRGAEETWDEILGELVK